MKLNEAKKWVKSFLPKNEEYDFFSTNIDSCKSYASLLIEINDLFVISENDANDIIKFMQNKGIKFYIS